MSTRLRSLLLSLLVLHSFSSGAQVGGNYVYQFLNVPASARIAALGGTLITVKDHDLNTALQAPSLINPAMDRSLALNGVLYPSGVRFGNAAYAQDFGKIGTFMAHMHYANYGEFRQTNVFGDPEGTFRAADYALNLGWGYQYNPLFSLGAGVKFIYSDYFLYNSFGLAVDISATYMDTVNNWTATILARHAGVQLDYYVKGNQEPLPIELLFGVSKRLKHTPLRFNITYRHLQRFDLSYNDPLDLSGIDPLTGEAQQKNINFWNKLSRHFIFGTEILLSKHFHVRAAYNFQRRRELVVDTAPGTVGFSFGFGLRISKFVLAYGRGNFHQAGGADHFSITMNLAEFSRKSGQGR